MNLGIKNKEKIRYQSCNKKTGSNKDKIEGKFNQLRMEIIDLKLAHKNIMKLIYKLSSFVPQEIVWILNKMGLEYSMNNKFVQSKQGQQNVEPFSSKNIEWEIDFERKDEEIKVEEIKNKDSAIKNDILQKLKALKMLESKENILRVENQKQEKFRRSLSKESLLRNCLKQIKTSNKKTYQSFPKWNTINHSHNQILITASSKNNSLENSPNFGSSNQKTGKQAGQLLKKLEESKVLSQFAKIQSLFCENKHEYYKGQTLNNLPHGKGALIACCQKIPVKINTKTLKYYGNFQRGMFEGKGVLFCKGNIKFQGIFGKGKREGEGVIILQGKCQKGIWRNDKLISFI